MDFLKKTGDNCFKIDYLNDNERNLDKDFTNQFTQPGITVNGNNKYNGLFDCDEVIVDITEKWMKLIYNVHELKQYFTPEIIKVMDNGLVNLREEYFIAKWLKVTDKTHLETLHNVYDKCNTFYDDLDVTPFFKSFEKTAKVFNRIDVLTKVTSNEINNETSLRSKLNFLVRAFDIIKMSNPDLKVFIHRVPLHEKKSDFINKLDLRFNMYAEDLHFNVDDVLLNTDKHNYEILMPLTGYNRKYIRDGANTEKRNEKTVSITPFCNMSNMDSETLIRILGMMG